MARKELYATDDLKEVDCLNCGYHYKGHICPNCGQRAGIQRLTIKQVLGEIPRTLLYLESRFARLLRDFYRDPISTIKTYSERRRKYYSSPVQAYYFFTSIYLILLSISRINDPVVEYEEVESSVGNLFDRIESAGDFVDDLSDTVYLYLIVPLFLGFSFAWFFRKSLNLAESIAMAYLFYIHLVAIWIIELILDFLGIGIEFYLGFFVIPSFLCAILFFKSFKKRKFLQPIRGAWAFLFSYLIIGICMTIYAIFYVYIIG